MCPTAENPSCNSDMQRGGRWQGTGGTNPTSWRCCPFEEVLLPWRTLQMWKGYFLCPGNLQKTAYRCFPSWPHFWLFCPLHCLYFLRLGWFDCSSTDRIPLTQHCAAGFCSASSSNYWGNSLKESKELQIFWGKKKSVGCKWVCREEKEWSNILIQPVCYINNLPWVGSKDMI